MSDWRTEDGKCVYQCNPKYNFFACCPQCQMEWMIKDLKGTQSDE